MDRSLIFSFLACFALACASGKHEPDCAPAPTPAPSHPEDLADTTEKEAIPNKPPVDDAPASPPEVPAAATAAAAGCVIPPDKCDPKENCPGITETCRTIHDAISQNDKAAFQKVVADRSSLAKAKDPRSAFGCPADGPIKLELERDCTRCRRMFVSFALDCGNVKGLIMVESNQITNWSHGKP